MVEEIVLGGGCFWCVEGAILGLRGVSEVIPGYSGGHVENPTYEGPATEGTGGGGGEGYLAVENIN